VVKQHLVIWNPPFEALQQKRLERKIILISF